MRRSLLLLSVFSLIVISCTKEDITYETLRAKDQNGYSYDYVLGDATNTRVYTLDNGLKIYLSVNKNEPRISTYIAVNVGSKHDPQEKTGLANCCERMMFKGSDSLGTLNWEEESVLIQAISDLYLEYGKLSDSEERRIIFDRIDSLSYEASKYAVANEYDKLCALIGARGTNAWTSFEETVFVNEIPSNELERWIYLEKERFQTLVLRLFHTEIETIYEEFNEAQDSDSQQEFSRVMEMLFKKHPYGRSLIGKAEHLQDPSMLDIMKFKQDYYVSNNIAICLSGDLDIENTVKLIDKYWGQFHPNDNIPEFVFDPEDERTGVSEVEIFGPERESVSISFRTSGNKTKEFKYLDMIRSILSNDGQAGVLDLNLVKKQKLLSADAYVQGFNDYGVFRVTGTPREGQSLEEVRELLIDEINKIKNGEFEEWLIDAIINEAKLSQIRSVDDNLLARGYVNCFIQGISWCEYIQYINELSKITKREIVYFANKFFQDNYVLVYKRLGEKEDAVHVEKPQITPVDINRHEESEFVREFKKIPVQEIRPVFIDYKGKIKREKIVNGVELSYINNKTTDLFTYNYIFDMGKDNMRKLPLAIQYLEFLGTKDKTAEDLHKQWYKMGISFNVFSSNFKSYVSISGLDENLAPAIELLEDLFANVYSKQDVFQEYIAGVLKTRADAKLDANTILWSGLLNYSIYGEKSSFTDVLSEEELYNIDANELVDIIKDLLSYKHNIFYYGPRSISDLADLIAAKHNLNHEFKDVPEKIIYKELDYDKPGVFIVDYDILQNLVLFVAKDQIFDKELISVSKLYNEYYAGSMSGILLQDLRESKGFAYTSSARYENAKIIGENNFSYAGISTRGDKLSDALKAVAKLLNTMPESEESFNLAKNAILKNISAERIVKTQVFWTYQQLLLQGLDYDIRKDIYRDVQKMKLSDLKDFFNKHIKSDKYNVLIVGKKSSIDMEMLRDYGNVRELSLEDVFNY